ncbi:glutaredoxin family protein [Paenibacillus mucilaginosus]|uniref:Glutaredoxin n=3 Tax=Paenibacillus mucilaginosus TaxID=61624 RepID=H6N9E9_9BACL|nr:glutaredoxin family protein [Paenibacillus mucilaginosus]AEI42151.1 glutaredoxin [Paenibacillus mucilaginosus KNP414]AFC27955.1 glutaredoxin [Paenibacillus mucilaginosus 3016]AFH60110.1 glutaredoxin [Paenibacillus mucilaginosus K02]MCG7214126.1 glutaredoxin family protein [Paenibacillus mucilaginosus]WDM28646.1 glutaredoxin family protein [Paenibacillus mucilaginosus]
MSTPVIVYSNVNCPFCEQVKGFLKEQGVDFEERNIAHNDQYFDELTGMGFQSVPVTVIGEHKILGMNTTRLKKALSAE